ncbi:2-thiouracil desulfurase family protein [Enterobacter mori]|uniref:2-thiouracil desulfurase family protein n=1 Tax=Enterobacter mori TaxID=539813 RepID=UPI0032AF6755
MSATTVPINPVPKICCSTGAKNRLVPHCPELAAGLPTPPLTAEMVSGQGIDVLNGHAQVVESDGHDVTQPCVLAAWLALKTALSQGCRFAIMTDGSPTCGARMYITGHLAG